MCENQKKSLHSVTVPQRYQYVTLIYTQNYEFTIKSVKIGFSIRHNSKATESYRLILKIWVKLDQNYLENKFQLRKLVGFSNKQLGKTSFLLIS